MNPGALQARSQYGSLMVTSFFVTCAVPPTIDEANIVDSPTIVVNRTVLLECPVSGVPVPRVRWLKNGRPLAFGRRVRRLDGERRVEIARAHVNDTARYTCVAANDAGQLRRNYDLRVLGASVSGAATCQGLGHCARNIRLWRQNHLVVCGPPLSRSPAAGKCPQRICHDLRIQFGDGCGGGLPPFAPPVATPLRSVTHAWRLAQKYTTLVK